MSKKNTYVKKKHLGLKKTSRSEKNCQAKKMDSIYQRQSNLDEENNFTIEISRKSNVEKGKFVSGDEYLLSSLDLKLKDEDMTKWKDI